MRRLLSSAATVYVNAAWAGTANGTPVTDSFGTHTFGIDAFATIQDGANDVAPSGTVNVDAGLYHENVTVSQPEQLVGANSGVAGSAVRSAESEVMTNGNQNAIFTVSSSNVTIDGFYLEGNDPSVTGGSLTSGADSNATYGVRPSGAFSNLTLEDSVIKDVAVGFRGDGASTGNLITANWFDSIGVYDFGYAVSLRTNFYADVTDNLMTQVQSGLHTNNFSGATGPVSWLFQGNTVQTYGAGVWDNLQYNGATPLTIDHNNISSLVAPNTAANAPVRSNYDGKSTGILIVSLQDSVGVNITNNSINGMGYGVILYNTTTIDTPTIGASNTITNNTVGVYLTNIVGFNPVTTTVLGGAVNNPTGPGNAVLDALTLSGNTTGVLVRGDNPSSSFGVGLTLQNGTMLSGGTTGLSVTGPLAALNGSTLADTAFAGQTGNYISLANSAESGKTIDATGASFDVGPSHAQVTGSALTLAQAFVVEDQITDAIDQNGLGFVRLQGGSVFVTPASFVAPATDDTGAVQRAVNAASPGDTVYAQSGLYPGQVQITKNLTLSGQGATTIIQANSSLLSPFSTSSGAKYPIVYASGGSVAVTNLTIDGDNLGNPYGDGFLGIAFYNAGGTADHLTIENVQNNPFNGVQNGVAVYADNTDAVSRTLNITNDVIQSYQKNGTALFGSGLMLNISGNTLTGAGATPLIAQNGIEVGLGATGTIANNHISGNEYSGAGSGSDQFNDVQSCGMLLFSTSGLIVRNNTVDGNDIGIYNNTDGATISGNVLGSVSPNRYEGILEDQGSSTISGNTITGGNLAIDVASFNGNTAPSSAIVDGNTVSGAAVGLEAIVQSSSANAVDMLAQNNGLAGNGEGVLISGGALVDLGEVSPNHGFTPLGTSVGNNTLTGYSGAPSGYAIDDENASTQPNVYAQNNNFGPVSAPGESAIQALIHDHGTNPAFSTVIFSPPQNVQPVPTNVYVNAAWAGLPFGTDPDGSGPAIGIGYDAFASIQAGVNAVAPGGTVHIEHNGTSTVYDESNILVGQAETIIGDSQSGVIVAPTFADSHTDSSFGGTASNGFVIASSNVTIEDLTIDGNANSSLAGTQNFRNAVITNSQNDNATYSNLTLDHLTVQNIYRKGIGLYNLAGVSAGNTISNSTFSNIGTNGNIAYEGAFAIAAFQSDATISDNTISGSGGGIGANSFDGAPGAPKLSVTGNTISSLVLNSPTNGALGMDLASLADGSTVTGNRIDTTGGNANDVGLIVSFANGQVTVRGNTIGGSAGDDAILLYQDALAATPVLVQNNMLSGAGIGSTGAGILLTARASDTGRFGDVAGPVYATLTGNTIDGFATGIGVVSDGLGGDTVNTTIGGSAAGDSNSVSNSDFGVLVSGAGADATITGNNTTFSGNGTAIAAENQGSVNSSNNTIEINSFQWGVSRGISTSSGGTVISRRDSIDMDPTEFAQAIFVDGGSFSGSNDLINGGGSPGTPGNGVGLYVSSNELPTESVSLNASEIEFVQSAIQDDNTTSGVAVDASGNYWGTNTEQGVAGTIIGAGAARVDYTPWLDNGTNQATAGGFDGDFSHLDVGSGGAQLQSDGRINEAVGLLTAGGTIQVYPGSYGEDVTLTKALTLESVGGVTVTDINGDGLADAVAVAPGVAGVVVGAAGRGFTINGGGNVAVGLNGTGELLADNVLHSSGGAAAALLAGTGERLVGNVISSSGSAWAVSISGGTALLTDNVFQSTGPGNVTAVDGSNTFSGNTFTAPPLAVESGFEQYRDTSAGLDSAGEITAVVDNNSFNRGVVHYSTGGITPSFSKIIWADIHPALAIATAGDTIGTLGGVYGEAINVAQNLTLVTSVANSGQTFINGGITIQGGVTLRLQSPASTPLLTSSLDFAPNGVLDLSQSTLLISYAGQNDPLATIRQYIVNGYNNGGWNGTPTANSGVITSSAAQANNGYMIGYADSADGVVVGQPANTIELRYTLGGDLDLSGTVNFSDFAKVVANFGKPASWDGGAVTYDSTVSFADFALTVANYGKHAVAFAAPSAVNVVSASLSSDPSNTRPSTQLQPAIAMTAAADTIAHYTRAAKVAARKRR